MIIGRLSRSLTVHKANGCVATGSITPQRVERRPGLRDVRTAANACSYPSSFPVTTVIVLPDIMQLTGFYSHIQLSTVQVTTSTVPL